MKKLIAFILAGTLIFGMSVQAFATTYSSATTDLTQTSMDTETSSGTVETETINYTSGGTSSTGVTVSATPSLSGYTVVWTGDVTVSETDDGTATVTFYVDSVTSDSTVVVYAYIDGEWVEVEATVEDGKIVVAGLEDGSVPIAIYVDDESVEAASDSGSTTSSSDSTTSSSDSTSSPQTGEFPVSGTLAVVIAAALAGMLLTQRRRSVEG
ncbi:MAG: hypothetical protein LUF32_08065 [Clostridiales bacterium]|nr:hypothetical protein [Clostridiales bacterium]